MQIKEKRPEERLTLDATVLSVDNRHVGKLDRFIVDSRTQHVDAFLLRTNPFHTRDLIVPIGAIARTDGEQAVHLTLTAAQVRDLSPYEEENFVVAASTEHLQWRYLIPTGGMPVSFSEHGETPDESEGTLEFAHDSALRDEFPSQNPPTREGNEVYDPGNEGLMAVLDPTNMVVETRSNLSEWEYRVGAGTDVVTRDGHPAGRLQTVDLDSEGRPERIVIATGVLHRARRAIPVAQIRSADTKQIVLTLTKREFDATT